MHGKIVQPVGFTIITTTPRWFHSAASSGGEVWPKKHVENKLWLIKEVQKAGYMSWCLYYLGTELPLKFKVKVYNF